MIPIPGETEQSPRTPTPGNGSDDALREHRLPADTRIVLYDGVCNLCNASVRFIFRRDRRGVYRFAHLQSRAGSRLAQQHDIDPEAMTSFVLIHRGRAWTRSDAWLRIVDSFGGAWRLAGVLAVLPRRLRDAAYDLVARCRYRVFGRVGHCRIPAPDMQARFLNDGVGTRATCE